MAHSTSGLIGPNVGLTHTSAQFPVGTRVTGTNGTVYVYCSAAAAIGQYRTVSITSAWAASQITPANSALAVTVGIAQVACAASSYFWCAIDGAGLYALVDGTADVLPGVLLAPGGLDSGLLALNTISTQQIVAGIRTITTISGTTATSEVVLNHPHVLLGTEIQQA